MVEGQGPMTPGNRRKRIGANSPAYFAEDEIVLENPCCTEVIFFEKTKKTMRKTGRQSICLQKRQAECFLDDLRSKCMSKPKVYEWIFFAISP